MSRQQLYREVVATTPGCRDNSCKDQNVATSISCRDVSFNEKRSRQEQAVATPPSLKTCRNNTETPATRTVTRTDVAMTALYVTTISVYWASLLKSKKKCIEIRAQLQNPINMQLKKEETQLGGDLKERSGLLKAHVFLFFFYFLLFFFRFSFDFILD